VDGFWATKSEGVGLIVRAISFQDSQPMWSWSINVTDRRTDRQTDRRTDGRTTCNLNTALCTTASRGKNVELLSWRCWRTSIEIYRPILCSWWRDIARDVSGCGLAAAAPPHRRIYLDTHECSYFQLPQIRHDEKFQLTSGQLSFPQSRNQTQNWRTKERKKKPA